MKKSLIYLVFLAEDDWNIHVSTIEELKNADVALVVYGETGNSGGVRLEAPPGKPIFQPNNEDGFRVSILLLKLNATPKFYFKDR